MINIELKNFLLESGISEEVIKNNESKIITIINSSDPKTNKKSLYGKIARYLSKPDILTQVNNFLNSSIKHLIDNMENVSDEVAACRMSTCQSCEFFDKNSVRCNSCGCFLKIKTRWASEKCPLDKWGPEVATEQNQETTPPQTQNSTEKPGGCGCGK